MVGFSNRAFHRNCCEARIMYSVYGMKERFIDAKMCNSSDGGMYFESDHDIHPGSEICIRIADYSPDIHSPEARDGYRAEVMWCRKIYKEDDASCYGIGARFIVNICDKCGEKTPYTKIFRTDEFVFLCPDCFNLLEAMSGEKKIKESVANYLLGNVI